MASQTSVPDFLRSPAQTSTSRRDEDRFTVLDAIDVEPNLTVEEVSTARRGEHNRELAAAHLHNRLNRFAVFLDLYQYLRTAYYRIE